MTMTLVSSVTVGSGGAASIDFTSIPQTGTDLLVLFSGRTDSAVSLANMYLYLNGNASNITRTLEGDGSSTNSNSYSGSGYFYAMMPGGNTTSNTFGSMSLYFPNYAASGTTKTGSFDVVTENNATSAKQQIMAYKYDYTTNAITSLSLNTSVGNFAQYSTASLYTITKGSGGATVS